MNRRSFLTGWGKPGQGVDNSPLLPRPFAAGLEPWAPSAAEPWDAIRAGHLLRRTTFGPRWSDIASILALSPEGAVDLLLNTTSNPDEPPVASSETESLDGLDITLQNQTRGIWRTDAQELREWYVDVLASAGVTIAEKMTAFWNGHFTTEFETEEDFVQAPLLYRQQKLFRDTGLGNFRALVKNVTLDSAMLIYLNGAASSAGRPNENYARELLELFTTGLGHYTEGDIKEAARILTGWRVSRYSDGFVPNGMFQAYFLANSHDTGAKEFMTVTFPARDTTTNTEFIVRRDEIHRLIDVIFEQRPRAIAEFICRKLYRFFVYSAPAASDESVIAAMADIFVQNDFEIRPVISTLLKSAHFFDNANIGAQIRTPMEFAMSLARQVEYEGGVKDDVKKLGQELFDPPNVSGWTGYRDWITTTTYPIRSDVSSRAVVDVSEAFLISLITSIPEHTNLGKLVDRLSAVLLPRPLSPERKRLFHTKLVPSGLDYEWEQIVTQSPATAARNLRDLLTTLVELPDFQLC